MKNKAIAEAMSGALDYIESLYSGRQIAEYAVNPEAKLYIQTWIEPKLKMVMLAAQGDKEATQMLQEFKRKGYLKR